MPPPIVSQRHGKHDERKAAARKRQLYGRAGSTRQWRAMRRAVAVRMVLAGGLPCPYCGEPVTVEQRWDLDHAVPRVAGGTDRLDNLRPAHAVCNRRAHANVRAATLAAPPSREW